MSPKSTDGILPFDIAVIARLSVLNDLILQTFNSLIIPDDKLKLHSVVTSCFERFCTKRDWASVATHASARVLFQFGALVRTLQSLSVATGVLLRRFSLTPLLTSAEITSCKVLVKTWCSLWWGREHHDGRSALTSFYLSIVLPHLVTWHDKIKYWSIDKDRFVNLSAGAATFKEYLREWNSVEDGSKNREMKTRRYHGKIMFIASNSSQKTVWCLLQNIDQQQYQ